MPPGVRLISSGALLMVKFGVLTVTTIEVKATTLPEVPVIVTVKIPGVAVALAVRVSVVPDVEGLGENEAVTPFGTPVAANCTLPLNPNCG